MAEKKKSVSLSLDMLTTKVDEIKAIDTQLEAAKGTISAQLAKGNEAADGLAFLGIGDTLSDVIRDLKLQLSIVEALHTECRNAWIKSNVDRSVLDGLKSQRDVLVTEATALKSTFVQLGLTEAAEVVLPDAPRMSSTGSASTKTEGIHFYYVRNGEKVYKQDSQNSLSSMAFYAPFKMPVAELKALLKTAGWDGTLTTTQQYAVSHKGDEIVIGWDVTPAPKA
jgi:hypothetical protein